MTSRYRCLYCGFPGHFIRVCPSRPPCSVVSTLQLELTIFYLTLLEVQLLTPHRVISVHVLVHPGSSSNFISPTLLNQLGLPRQRQEELKVETIQGTQLGCGHIKFRSPPITQQIRCLHSKKHWRDPLQTSSCDAPGSHNILQKLDGTQVRS